MSDELLSALMDGQCTPAEVERVLAAIDDSPVLRARWSRMVLARDVLAGARVRKAAPDFAFDVMAAIEADELQEAAVPSPKVVPLRRVVVEPVPAVVAVPRRARRWQPAVGLAAAASITAAVVVMGGNFLTRPVAGPAPLAANQSIPAQDRAFEKLASELASTSNSASEPRETGWTQIDSAAARQLNDFLMEHSNSRTEAGMGGALSYARLAVRTADYRQAEEPR